MPEKQCKKCHAVLPENSAKAICDECAHARKDKRIATAKSVARGVGIALIFIGTLGLYAYLSSDEERLDSSDNDTDSLPDNNDSYPTCDACGDKMTIFDDWAWYTCPTCGNSVRIIDGTTTWSREIFGPVSRRTCENCGQSLSGGSFTPAWADGDNDEGYTECPHCGYYNFKDID